MDNNRPNQAQLNYSCGAGTAAVNLYTGRMQFEFSDMSIGANSYGIGVSHIYDSRLTKDRRVGGDAHFPPGLPKNIGTGTGWTLNVQQYIFPEGENRIYIDGQGYRHTFVPLTTVSSAVVDDMHYDTTGLGLNLSKIVCEDEGKWVSKYVMEDNIHNMMIFSSHGYLAETRKCLNPEETNVSLRKYITKKYIYNEYFQLIKIYDTRNIAATGDPTRWIELTYSDNGMLLSMSSKTKESGVSKTHLTVGYEYDYTNNLIATNKTAAGTTKPLARYYYSNGGAMKYAVDFLDKTALWFEYESGGVSKVHTGVCGLSPVYKDNQIISGENTFCGENQFSSENARELTGYEITLGSFEEKNYDIISYAFPNQASVTNDKGVKIVYSFIDSGETAAVYEDSSVSNKQIYTSVSPNPDTGVRMLNFAGSGADSFDGSVVVNFKKPDGNDYVISSGYFSIQKAKVYKKIDESKKIERKITISAWVKYLSSSNNSNVLLKVNIKHDGGNSEAQMKIDKTKAGIWQFISNELSMPAQSIIDYSVSVQSSSSVEMSVSNIRATVNEAATKFNGTDIRDIDHIRLNQDNDRTIYLAGVRAGAGANFITTQDIHVTMYNMYRAEQRQEPFFNVVYNNGKKIITGVQKVEYLHPGGIINLIQNNDVQPLFYTEMKKDDKINYLSYIVFAKENNEIMTYLFNKGLSKNKSSYEKTTYNSKGFITEEMDEYKVQKLYTYDSTGNLEKTVIQKYGENDNAKKIIYKNIFSENKEHLDIIQDSREGKTSFSYNNPSATLNSIVDPNKTKSNSFEYDSFNERLMGINSVLKNSAGGFANVYSKNSFEYNTAGRLSKLTHNNFDYKINYNSFGDISEFFVCNQKIFEKSYNYIGANFVSTTYANSGATKTACFDKYNRLKEVTESRVQMLANEFANADYLNNTSAAKLRKSIDFYSGITHTYNFNDDDNLTGYSYDGKVKGSITAVEALSESEKRFRYKFRDHEYDFVIEYDPDVLINPRINYAYYSTSANLLPVEYYYDSLGRVSEKGVDNYVLSKYEYYDYLSENNERYTSALLKRVEIYRKNNTLKFESAQEYTYDANGNITGIINSAGENKEYKYDEHNRLFYADKNTYRYDKGGNREKKENTTHEWFYVYDEEWKDRLITINKAKRGSAGTSEHFKYDACGNPTHYKTPSVASAANMKWTRGKLLESYNGAGYKYNAEGVRTQKTVNGKVRDYYLDGDRLLREDTNGDYDTAYVYFYDMSGIIAISTLNGFWYLERDIQGNVVRLRSERSNDEDAIYSYDAWGVCTVKDTQGNIITDPNHTGNKNPIRWKGHYYDTESGFYYINGNYYDPDTGRYINAGMFSDLLTNAGEQGQNLYVLADNNPLSFVSSLTNVLPSMELEPQVKKKKRWLSWLLAGLGAIISGISVLTTGCVPIAMMVVAGLTVVAGTAAMVFGINEAADYYTEKNFLKEKCGWSQTTYDKVATGVEIAAVVGAVVCEIYSFSRLARGAQCFKAGTQVLTESGKKNIEEINAGDKVWAYDEETGERALKEVVQLFRNEASRKTSVKIKAEDGTLDEIISTPGHKYYLPDNKVNRNADEKLEHASYEGLGIKWVSAENLKRGDRVLLSDRKYGIVKSVKTENCEKFTTYNLEVEDFHTYYVGENGTLVHNFDCRGKAFSDAKKYLDIADDAVPDGFDTVEISRGVRGKPYNAKVYKYGDKWIRDDMGGHRFWDKILKRWTGHQPSHFNVGIGSLEHGQIRGIHFYYR